MTDERGGCDVWETPLSTTCISVVLLGSFALSTNIIPVFLTGWIKRFAESTRILISLCVAHALLIPCLVSQSTFAQFHPNCSKDYGNIFLFFNVAESALNSTAVLHYLALALNSYLATCHTAKLRLYLQQLSGRLCLVMLHAFTWLCGPMIGVWKVIVAPQYHSTAIFGPVYVVMLLSSVMLLARSKWFLQFLINHTRSPFSRRKRMLNHRLKKLQTYLMLCILSLLINVLKLVNVGIMIAKVLPGTIIDKFILALHFVELIHLAAEPLFLSQLPEFKRTLKKCRRRIQRRKLSRRLSTSASFRSSRSIPDDMLSDFRTSTAPQDTGSLLSPPSNIPKPSLGSLTPRSTLKPEITIQTSASRSESAASEKHTECVEIHTEFLTKSVPKKFPENMSRRRSRTFTTGEFLKPSGSGNPSIIVDDPQMSDLLSKYSGSMVYRKISTKMRIKAAMQGSKCSLAESRLNREALREWVNSYKDNIYQQQDWDSETFSFDGHTCMNLVDGNVYSKTGAFVQCKKDTSCHDISSIA